MCLPCLCSSMLKVPFNLLERLISEMKGVGFACLQDMFLLFMQRAVQVMALET